jgi:hypothetical protein
VDEPELRRRIEVYVENGLPDLASERSRIGAMLGRDLWPLVDGWQRQMRANGELLKWIVDRLQAEWPDTLARLQLEQTGSRTGWFLPMPRDITEGGA